MWAADLVPPFILGIAFTLTGAVPEQGPGSVRCTQYYSLIADSWMGRSLGRHMLIPLTV